MNVKVFACMIALGLAFALAACGKQNTAVPDGFGTAGEHSAHSDGSAAEHTGTEAGVASAASMPAMPAPETQPQQAEPSASEAPSGSAESADDRKEAEVYEVSIENFAFSPNELTVPVGAKITFTNKDKVQHTATADGAFDSGYLKQDESYTVELSQAGTYDVYCTPHPFMKLTIKVK